MKVRVNSSVAGYRVGTIVEVDGRDPVVKRRVATGRFTKINEPKKAEKVEKEGDTSEDGGGDDPGAV